MKPRLAAMPEATFDLTPMIDVVLLLIIFFMLSSQFAQTIRRPLPLPQEAGQLGVGADKSSVLIDLEKDGTLWIAGRRGSRGELGATFESMREQKPGAAIDVVIRADRACPARELDALAASLLTAGVDRWKIATTGAPRAPGVSGAGKVSP